MTLLQTRVDDKVASRFKLAARKRNLSPYQLLSELIEQAATTEMPGWEEQRAWLEFRDQPRLKENAVVATRKNEDR